MDETYTREMADIQATHWWYEGRRDILAGVIGRLGLSKDARILEAGCGPGANLEMLEGFGQVDALEPEAFSVEHAQSISGANVMQGGLPTPIPFKGAYDLVCAFDVIEHIEDDLGSVRALLDVTKAGGYALFTVPAYMWIWGAHDEVNHHKRRYTRTGFKALLDKAGYEVRFVSYYNFWLFPLAVVVRMVETLRGDENTEMKVPSTFVNKVLRWVFASERFFFGKFMGGRVPLPFGLSVIALCQKK